jgi:HAD superfamily hydrolase (TIGR01509 family)
MARHSLPKPSPIEAVLFDFHSTLVDQGDPHHWLELAWARTGRVGSPAEAFGQERFDRLAHWITHIWEHVLEVDPHNERDLSPRRHREVFDALMARVPDVDPELSGAMYEELLTPWTPYDDALPVLTELRRRGILVALVSNVGVDVRGILETMGLKPFFDAVVLSYEAGSVKPEPSIFLQALEALGVEPTRALMVGDNPSDDAGAARLGIRTLILPRTQGGIHGLELVLRMVGPDPVPGE